VRAPPDGYTRHRQRAQLAGPDGKEIINAR
jgi:hypothetical protein